MKQTLLKITLIACIISLTACSSNTQNQNTAAGAGTGAVAGGLLGTMAKGAGAGWVVVAGALVGALIGGTVGHSMDSTDHQNMNAAMNNNAENEATSWTNEKTGVVYRVVPKSSTFAYKGFESCRYYVAHAKHHGKRIKTKAIGCRMTDGTWQQVK